MSDAAILISILMVYLAVGIVINVVVLGVAVGDLLAVVRSRRNGPRQVIAISAVRRKVIRLLIQCGLFWLYVSRVVRGQPATPVVAFVVGLVILTCVNTDAIADYFDRKMLRWFLRSKDA